MTSLSRSRWHVHQHTIIKHGTCRSFYRPFDGASAAVVRRMQRPFACLGRLYFTPYRDVCYFIFTCLVQTLVLFTHTTPVAHCCANSGPCTIKHFKLVKLFFYGTDPPVPTFQHFRYLKPSLGPRKQPCGHGTLFFTSFSHASYNTLGPTHSRTPPIHPTTHLPCPTPPKKQRAKEK